MYTSYIFNRKPALETEGVEFERRGHFSGRERLCYGVALWEV